MSLPTREQVYAESGMQLDAWIAEHIMGWQRHSEHYWSDGKNLHPVASFSPRWNIYYAMEVVKQMRMMGWFFNLLDAIDGNEFIAMFFCTVFDDVKFVSVDPALAISKAAMLATVHCEERIKEVQLPREQLIKIAKANSPPPEWYPSKEQCPFEKWEEFTGDGK